MNSAEVNVDLLPPLLQTVVDLIGLEKTFILVKARGGVRLYVPKGKMADDHDLVRMIGREAAEALQAEFGGMDHFDLPRAERALRAIKHAEVKRMREQFSVRTVALECELTERGVRKICGRLEDDRQDQLF